MTFTHGPTASKSFDLGPLTLFGRRVSIFWYSFRTTQEGHTSRVCGLRRESLKQDRPPAQILDQTARPFKVRTEKKNDGLQSALQIYISHKSHATLTRCLGYSLLKGHAHSLQTEEAKRLLRRRQGWERYFQSLWRSILHCNTSHWCIICANHYCSEHLNVTDVVCFEFLKVPPWIFCSFFTVDVLQVIHCSQPCKSHEHIADQSHAHYGKC